MQLGTGVPYLNFLNALGDVVVTSTVRDEAIEGADVFANAGLIKSFLAGVTVDPTPDFQPGDDGGERSIAADLAEHPKAIVISDDKAFWSQPSFPLGKEVQGAVAAANANRFTISQYLTQLVFHGLVTAQDVLNAMYSPGLNPSGFRADTRAHADIFRSSTPVAVILPNGSTVNCEAGIGFSNTSRTYGRIQYESFLAKQDQIAPGTGTQAAMDLAAQASRVVPMVLNLDPTKLLFFEFTTGTFLFSPVPGDTVKLEPVRNSSGQVVAVVPDTLRFPDNVPPGQFSYQINPDGTAQAILERHGSAEQPIKFAVDGLDQSFIAPGGIISVIAEGQSTINSDASQKDLAGAFVVSGDNLALDPEMADQEFFALGDKDTIITSGNAATLFALGNGDTLVASGKNDVVVGNEAVIESLATGENFTSLSGVLIDASGPTGNETIYSSLNAFDGNAGNATLGQIPVNETIIGGAGTDTVFADLASGTDNVTIVGGNGNDKYFYNVPIINNPQKQGIVQLFAGNGNDTVGGIGPAEIDLGNGSDVVLPGFGSVVNAGKGQDVIGVANDVQLNGLKANDRISMFGIYDLTGGIQWAGLESPFAYGADGTRYGLNQNGDLVIEDVFGDTLFVSNYHGGPGVPANQETAGIFIAQDSVSAGFLLNPNLPQGWLWGQMAFVNSLSKAYDGPNFGIYGGVDPLVFDLAGNGIDLTAASSTAPVFDMNGNGFAVHTGWVEPGSGDGILVLDRDGASQITNIDQLIGGEATAGGVSAVGFAQLAQYDSNLDGVINASDPIYSQLRIWVDSDGAGTGELLTLQQAGIASINLADTAQTGDLVSGDQILATSTFTRTDGSTAEVADVSFQTDNFNTTFTGNTSVSAAAAALPDLKGYGTLTDLQVAMTNDPALADPALGPSLMSIVQATVPTLTSLDLPTLRTDITPLLTAWTNAVQGVDANGNPLPITTESHADVPILVSTDSTGAMTVVDFAYEITDAQGSYWALASGDTVTDANGNPIARPTLAQVEAQPPAGEGWTTFSGAQLDFMERYTGDPLPLGTGAPLDAGAALQAAIPTIQTLWQTLNQLAVALAMQGPLAPYFQGVVYDAATNHFEPTNPGQQLTPMYEAIFHGAPQDAAGAASWLATWKPILDVVLGEFDRGQGLQITYGYLFANMVPAFEAVGLPLDITTAAAALGVPANEIVEGGNTLLSAGQTDIFYMSNGDQTAIGGTGVENYVLGGHFGHDVIDDDEPFGGPQNPSVLRLTTIKSTDVTAIRSGNDLILDDKATGQQVTVVNEFIGVRPSLLFSNTNDVWGVTQIAFADGVVWEEPDMAEAVALTTNGVNGTLLGTSAFDVLNGGNGNHFLSGGDGGDIYLYDRGNGNDTILVNRDNPFDNGLTSVQFGPGLQQGDLSFSRNGNSNDLLITVDGDPGDSLLIQGQFTATFTGVFGTQFFDQVQDFHFSVDDSDLNWHDVENTLIANAEATPGEALYGFDGVDNTLDPGVGGSRFMSGGNNNDTYVFGLGYGNDTIKGGHGNILTGQNQTVLFNPDVDPSQVQVIRNGNSNDATLVLSDGSTLLLQNQFDAIFTGAFGTRYLDRMATFQFQDTAQTVWTADDLMNKALAYEETNGGHTIFGFDGFDQTIDPGPGGNFFISGGNNNDTYVFGLGYGNDTIKGGHGNILSGGNQTILFNPGVDPAQVQVVRNADSGDVTLVLSDGSTLAIENQFVNAGSLNIWPDRIDNFQFQDAAHTLWTVDDVMNKAIAQQEAVPGGAIYGFQRGETIDPGLGGNRFMSGEGGPDVYIFGQGYGHDTLFENGGLFASNGTEVLFNSDVDPSTVGFERVGASNDLEIFLADGSELDIQGQFDPTRAIGPSFLDRIWNFQFQDAAQTSFSYLDIEHKLIAQEEAVAGGTVYDFAFGNGLAPGQGNTLDGFAGNETLVGAQASFTTFVFGRGDGHEVVDGGQDTDPFLPNYDILRFGQGITASALSLTVSGNDLVIGVAGASDTVTIKNEIAGISGNLGPNPVSEFDFAGGTSWSLATIEQAIVASEEASGSHTIGGFATDDTLDGFAGNDYLQGNGGNDTYIFGHGYAQEIIDNFLLALPAIPVQSVLLRRSHAHRAPMGAGQTINAASGLAWLGRDQRYRTLISSPSSWAVVWTRRRTTCALGHDHRQRPQHLIAHSSRLPRAVPGRDDGRRSDGRASPERRHLVFPGEAFDLRRRARRRLDPLCVTATDGSGLGDLLVLKSPVSVFQAGPGRVDRLVDESREPRLMETKTFL
jgi:Ca2+-binding RTX toxin-like protein